jgi:hypothetical protein
MNRRNQVTEGRRRIVVGIARLAIITAFAAQLGVLQLRADPAPPLKLVYAHTESYSTALLLSAKADATEAATGLVTNCGGGFGYPYNIGPGIGAAYEPELAQYLCGDSAFILLDAPANVDAISVISYQDGIERSSFVLAPIGAVTNDHPFTSPAPLVTSGDQHAYITTFATADTPMRVTVFGGSLAAPQSEEFVATPPVSQYEIHATGVYFVAVSIRPCQLGPCPAGAAVYGFVSGGDPRGGTFRGFGFGR